MPRPTTGSFETRFRVDGTRSFHIRVPVNGEREPITLHEVSGCPCGCGGGWDEPSARTEMGNILARIRAGVWERSTPVAVIATTPEAVPLYSEYGDSWLSGKVDGVIGKKPIRRNTKSRYRWRLRRSQRFFAGEGVDEIDERGCLNFKAHLLKESRELQEAIDAGADLRDDRDRRIVPLSLSSIKANIDGLAAVLDEAVADGYRADNPARSERMKLDVPKPKRTFLEIDELAALLDAARDQDVRLPDLSSLDIKQGSSAEKVARLAATGKRPSQIAVDLSLSKATVTYHLRRLKIDVGRGYVGRRAVCELLARAGLRASELCDLKIGLVRLHDPDGARLRIVDAKTEAGERVVEVTPDLVEVLIEHIDRLRRAGLPTGPDAYLIPNARGGRISRQRIRKIVAAAAKLARERLIEKGHPPLPKTTPHTLRRTYVSIALLANQFDVKWVMDQVGHTDSAMTLDVYTQLQKRIKRSHGTKFDGLIREAQDRTAPVPIPA